MVLSFFKSFNKRISIPIHFIVTYTACYGYHPLTSSAARQMDIAIGKVRHGSRIESSLGIARSTEASSTVRALSRALFSVIITLLNDSERSLNKKWRRPVTNKSNPPKWLEIKAKHRPTFSLNCSISYIHTKKHTSSFRKLNLKILHA